MKFIYFSKRLILFDTWVIMTNDWTEVWFPSRAENFREKERQGLSVSPGVHILVPTATMLVDGL